MISQLLSLLTLLIFLSTSIAYSQVLPFGRGVVTGEGGGTDDQIALEVPFTPEGSIAATNVQAAIQEVRDEAAGGVDTDDQIASEVPFTPTGTIAGTNTQTAVAEVATEAASNLATHEADSTSVHGIADTSVLVTQTTLDAHVDDTTDAHNASSISYAGGTGMAATDVEVAIDELATEKANSADAVMDGDTAGGVLAGTYPNPSFASDLATQVELDAHINDTSAAHAATSVGVTPFGTIAATQVQAALEEIVNEATGGTDDQTAAEVPVTPFGTIAATDVQAALEEIVTESTGGTDDQTATEVPFTPTGTIAGTDTQAAVAEVASEAASNLASHEADTTSIHGIADTSVLVTQTTLTAHIDDTADAHDATAISYAGGTGIVATDVEAAIDELATEKANTDDARFPTSDEKAGLAANLPTAANPVITQNELTASAGIVTSAARPPDSGDPCILEDRWRDTSTSPATWYLPADCTLDAEVWTATTSEALRNVGNGVPTIDEQTLTTDIKFSPVPRIIEGEPIEGSCRAPQDAMYDKVNHQFYLCDAKNSNPTNINLHAPYFMQICDSPAGNCITANLNSRALIIQGELDPLTNVLIPATMDDLPTFSQILATSGGTIGPLDSLTPLCAQGATLEFCIFEQGGILKRITRDITTQTILAEHVDIQAGDTKEFRGDGVPAMVIDGTTADVSIEGSVNFCADSGGDDTYACSIVPEISRYTTGSCYNFSATTPNTGAASLNLNALGAKTIKKAAGGVTTDLADNDIRANQLVEVCYDGTNMQMQSPTGNAPTGITASSTDTLTNKTLDAEGTGNVITVVDEDWFDAAGCDNVTAGHIWDTPTTNAPAPTCDTGESNLPKGYLAFDATTDEAIRFKFRLPTGFTGGIDFTLRWKAAATTGDTTWCVQLVRQPLSGAVNPTLPAQGAGNCVSDAADATTLEENEATITGVTCTSCVAGDMVYGRLSRDADQGALGAGTDDMANDAFLLGWTRKIRRAM